MRVRRPQHWRVARFVTQGMMCTLFMWIFITVIFRGKITNAARKKTANPSTNRFTYQLTHNSIISPASSEESGTDLTNDQQIYCDNCDKPLCLRSRDLSLPFQLTAPHKYLNLLDYKPPPFLKNYRNPCWYEEETEGHLYQMQVEKIEGNEMGKKPCHIRCLPFFYLAGFVKCGTGSLFLNLRNHPMIPTSNVKEIHWWNRYRSHIEDNLDLASPIGRYVDRYAKPAIALENYTIKTSRDQDDYHPMILGDGSTTIVSSQWSWWRLPENKGRQFCKDSPAVINAHYIRHVTPDAKIIITMRNPADRLYSHWTMRTRLVNASPERFHDYVEKVLGEWNTCINKHSITTCAWCSEFQGEIFLPSLYFPYLKGWLDVFPRRQLQFVKLEEFSKDRLGGLNKIFKFLGLDPVDEQVLDDKPRHMKVGCSTCDYSVMLNKTRHKLENFYRPYNQMTADLLRDERWKFD